MQSLATLSEEKARIEAGFQADRKVMLVSVYVHAFVCGWMGGTHVCM